MDEIYAKTDAELATVCRALRGCGALALDTEFMREKTYYPQLCLIQLAGEGALACVDVLSLDDLTPLLDVIYDAHVVKVLHSATQDLEVLANLRGQPPRPVFDTQVAATVLGFGAQVSYAALVDAVLGVKLDKLHTRTDWGRRPLSAEQIRYAFDDVRYLLPLYERTRATLEEQGRADWLHEDLTMLTEPARYANLPDQAWLRVRGIEKLNGVQRAALRALATWRETQAQAQNRPRQWVVGDDTLLALARRMPTGLEALGAIRGLQDGVLRRHGNSLLECIEQARALPRSGWPQWQSPPRLTDDQDALIDAMMALVKLRGAQTAVSPSMLATRKDLARLISGDENAGVLSGWRRRLVGNDLLALLEGRCSLQVHAGRLTLAGGAEQDG